MPDVGDHLKTGFQGLALDEVLQKPTSALFGVSDAAATALKRIGVETVFDLGASWLFANAAAAMALDSAEPGTSGTHLLEPAAPDEPEEAASRALESLRGISDEDATQIKQALGTTTIREFALWPPREVARRLLGEASGAIVEGEDVHAEALRPRLGEYPTERVYYDSLVMLGMAASPDQQPLTGTISLQPVVDDPSGFGQPAIGALVTLSQSWYAKGITLGHMLHSLALAPGEATRIAVIDWSRRTRASVSETIEETEALDSASEHSRAISEVQNAVANEMQSGGSMSSGWAKSSSKGKAGGFSIGGGVAGAVSGVTGALGFGGGSSSSSQSSQTSSGASSSSWSIGNRSVMAELSQRVNDRTEQHSTSVRNRRASAVREVSQSEHMAHLQANRTYYSQAVLANIDTATLVMLLSRFTWNGKPLVDQVEPKPLAMTGNYLVLRAPVEDSEASGIDGTTWGKLLSDRSLNLAQRDDRLVPIPTGGVFAEAVLGRSNSAEKLDITRFWNWQDSPIPLQPPEIAPVATGSRGTSEDLRPGQLSAPVLNVLTPTSLPEPTGLTAAMTALANGSMFRDMSGLAGTQALAQAASAGTLDAATEAGRLASTNLKTVTDQAVAMGQTAADMWKTAQANKNGGGGGGSGGSGGTGSSISADGARINHGRDMDQRGVTNAARSPSSSGFRVTEQQSEFQAAGSAGDSGGAVGNGASSEFVFAETAATGVSPSQIAATTNALGGGVANAAAFSALSSSVVSSLSMTALLDNLLLTVIRIDTEASGLSMQGINLRPMTEHKHGKEYIAIELGAWTNSTTDVFYNIKAHMALIDLARKKLGLNEAKALLFVRGMAVGALRHELVHIKQFISRNGKTPVDYLDMVDLEIKAYGCDPTNVDPQSTQKWLDDTGASGANVFLTTKLNMDQSTANLVIDKIQDALDERCAILRPLPGGTSAAAKTALVANDMLPAKVNGSTNYKIGELYQ
ncbi:hypothetical protein GCM10025759_06930 [Lysobacter panacisoli]|uniref:Uncharacterized protein n=2 Tax=Lysobacter panacisoli TaxID=1255263 RepID=A0ABP9L601_9GAMM